MNTCNSFFQLSSKEDIPQNEKLDRALNAWARIHGIQVESLTTLRKQFPDRYNHEAIGVTDFANSLIGLADNRYIDTFAEEVAHFAIELLGNTERTKNSDRIKIMPIGKPYSIREAVEKVNQLNIYKEVKEEYKNIYDEEIDFKKEALAKILSKEIIYIFEVKEIMRKKQSRYMFPWRKLSIARDDTIYFLNRIFGITTIRKNDIEISIKRLAKDIVNQEKLLRRSWFSYYPIDVKTIKPFYQYFSIQPWTGRDVMY